jgi:DNA topoisomerase-1
MNLIIVESPTKARTLSKILGKDYVIEATMGHIKDLPKSELGVDIENNFKPDYLLVAKKKEVVDKILNAVKKIGEDGLILLATDPDREGEAIASHVAEIILDKGKVKKDILKRITFHEITKEALYQALASPSAIDSNLVDAQTARRVLDRLVGYKLSPLLWKKVRRGLSAGRVQTVAVRLIVEKEREIEAFSPQEYWEITAELEKDKEKFVAKLLEIEGKKAEVKNQNEAEAVVSDLEKSNYFVLDVIKKEVRKAPHPPFTTSTLTQAAANLFFWSSKRTMSIAQRLYEKGLITYHRTDSVNIAEVALLKARDYIKANFDKSYLPGKPRVFKKKAKLAQEAHEAIRPADPFLKPYSPEIDVEPEGHRLYELIWKRFMASQMAESVYDETKVKVRAQGSKDYLFGANGLIMKFDGWKVLYSKKSEDVVLPKLEKGDKLSLVKLTPEQKFTQPPARYTEASLIKTLEKLGIGRPSTYAPIISTIQLRNYVEKKEGKFYPTKIGIAVNDFLIPNFNDIFDYSFTARMEDNLDLIAKGNLVWQNVIRDFWSPFVLILESVEANSQRVKIEADFLGKKCPECKEGDLVIRIGRFGKFVSCSRFPECKYREKYVEKIGISCPECKKGEVVVKRTAKGKKFYGCSRYPDCKWASWRKPQANNPTPGVD